MRRNETPVDLYIDVSPLFERHWTGISAVCAEIAGHFLDRPGWRVSFVAFDRIVETSVVRHALGVKEGSGLGILFQSGVGFQENVYARPARELASAIAIHSNFKRGVVPFGKEIVFVHDLSFETMPELHDRAGTADFRHRLYADCRRAELVICNSMHTRADVVTYYGIPEERVKYVHLGCSKTTTDEASRALAASLGKFCLVLGTVEPRKNHDFIARFIAETRGHAEGLKFVFVGRDGWGPSFDELLRKHKVPRSPAIERLGFVSESLKWALLEAAHLVVYPSIFEGFGLPVVEAMAAGAVVCASFTSSIAEIGLQDALMFDPTNYWEFRSVMEAALDLDDASRQAIAEENLATADRYSWERFRSEFGALVEACAAARETSTPPKRDRIGVSRVSA